MSRLPPPGPAPDSTCTRVGSPRKVVLIEFNVTPAETDQRDGSASGGIISFLSSFSSPAQAICYITENKTATASRFFIMGDVYYFITRLNASSCEAGEACPGRSR